MHNRIRGLVNRCVVHPSPEARISQINSEVKMRIYRVLANIFSAIQHHLKAEQRRVRSRHVCTFRAALAINLNKE